MSFQRPKTGALVWIEYQGLLQRAVYQVHNDTFLLGDGTHIAARNGPEWFADLPEGFQPANAADLA